MRPVVRPPVRPRLLAFASISRLTAVHGDGSRSAMARVSALADLVPGLSVPSAATGYHAVDVAVSSTNPVLATLVLSAADRAGLRSAVLRCHGDDPWPYDLAATDEVGHVVASALGVEVPGYAAGRVTGWLLARLLDGLSRAPLVVDGTASPADRQPGDERACYLGPSPPSQPPSGEQMFFSNLFDGRLRLMPHAGMMPRGRTVLFARRFVLTGRPSLFTESRVEGARIGWPQGVAALGSAAWNPETYPDAARAMLGDIIGCARARPSSALLPDVDLAP